MYYTFTTHMSFAKTLLPLHKLKLYRPKFMQDAYGMIEGYKLKFYRPKFMHDAMKEENATFDDEGFWYGAIIHA